MNKRETKFDKVIHKTSNAHTCIRVRCEKFVSDFEEGFKKNKTDKELLDEALFIFKFIIDEIDKINDYINKINDSRRGKS